MKRLLKIVGWIVAFVVLFVVIVEVVVCSILFRPNRLTPIVNRVADSLLTCPHELGEVKLTYFSTFPYFCVSIRDLRVMNPIRGVTNDTLVEVPRLVANVNVREFIRNKNLFIREIQASDLQAHIYIDSTGQTNLNVLRLAPDTTVKDTIKKDFPFRQISLDNLNLSAQSVSFTDERDSMSASLGKTKIKGSIVNWDDICVDLDMEDASLSLGATNYASHVRAQIHLPVAIDLDSLLFDVNMAHVAVNNLSMVIDGTLKLMRKLEIDMSMQLSDWSVPEVLALLPTSIATPIQNIGLDWSKGRLSLTADAVLDMNRSFGSATIRSLKASTMHTDLTISGKIDNFLRSAWMNLVIQANTQLSDLKTFCPTNISLQGRAKADLNINTSLKDLLTLQLQEGQYKGTVDVQDVHFSLDSLTASTPETHIAIQVPNPQCPKRSFFGVDIAWQGLNVEQPGLLDAQMGKATIHVDASKILKDNEPFVGVHLTSDATLHANYDTLSAMIQHPNIIAEVKYSRKEKSIKQITSSTSAKAITFAMGNYIHAQTGEISVAASSIHHPNGSNFLLRWMPTLGVNLTDGQLEMSDFDCPIVMPYLQFMYSNRITKIMGSKLQLGRSDFALSGTVKHIGKWLMHKEILEGEFNFDSDYTDVNQLMALFSADNGSAEVVDSTALAQVDQQDTTTMEPFLVPTDVDLTLKTNIREADAFNQHMSDVGGTLCIRNGCVVLDQMGFVCRAAKLQLTAMYRTPRRNHLYLGLDYHMLDVDLDELVHIIPDIDTLMPMLSSFKGKAEFHLAGESYFNAQYEPKLSTLRGACSITGKDLVVIDGETFSEISKKLMFNKKTENKVDSIRAEITVYKKEIDVYPFCVQMDKYIVALGGRHNLDMTFNYDINVLRPLYLGVNVSGSMDDLDIHLAPCKFAKNFRPVFYQKVDKQTLELQNLIRDSMRQNVKIQ